MSQTNAQVSTPKSYRDAELGEPIALATGIAGAARHEIALAIYERRVRDDSGLLEDGHPAILTIAQGPMEDPKPLTFSGTLRGLGEQRAIVLSVRNFDAEAQGGGRARIWADVFRGKWQDGKNEIVGVFVPMNTATHLAGLYRDINRIREAEPYQKARRDADALTKEFGQPVRLWPDLGVVHFKIERTSDQPARPNRGPGM